MDTSSLGHWPSVVVLESQLADLRVMGSLSAVLSHRAAGTNLFAQVRPSIVGAEGVEPPPPGL